MNWDRCTNHTSREAAVQRHYSLSTGRLTFSQQISQVCGRTSSPVAENPLHLMLHPSLQTTTAEVYRGHMACAPVLRHVEGQATHRNFQVFEVAQACSGLYRLLRIQTSAVPCTIECYIARQQLQVPTTLNVATQSGSGTSLSNRFTAWRRATCSR